MGAPENGHGGGAGNGAPEMPGRPPAGGAAQDVDYAWLQEQLAALGMQLGNARIEDEIEDEFEEWHDPSDGLLSDVFEACERDAPDDLAPLLARLRDSEWSIDTRGPDGDTALHIAALYGSDECVKQLLAAGARVDALNQEDGTSAIHDAAAGGYTEILMMLVDAAKQQLSWVQAADGGMAPGAVGGAGVPEGAVPDAATEQAQQQGDEGGAAAAAAGLPQSLVALLNLRDIEGETALHTAARGNHAEAVRLLLSLGCNPTVAANDGSLPVDEPDEDEVIAILREAMEAPEGDGEAEGP